VNRKTPFTRTRTPRFHSNGAGAPLDDKTAQYPVPQARDREWDESEDFSGGETAWMVV